MYVTRLFVPSLKSGDIVSMDNFSGHKAKGVVEVMEAVGALVLFLPPYSPDMNPIELMWPNLNRGERNAHPGL